MRPIASSRRKRPPDDAAFTLTEMAASLVVAAMLVSGLGELTRQYARTMVRVRADVEETRDARLAQAELAALERVEPGALTVRADAADAEIGGRRVRVALSSGATGEARLSWEDDDGFAARAAAVEPGARFELGTDGALRLWSGPGDPPLVVVIPRRTAPFDCQFDVVVRDCR